MLLILFVIALCLFLGILFYCYYNVFYSPIGNQCDPHNVPDGSQYQPYHKTMLSMIDSLDALPFEEVSVSSFDGLRLTGKYYHVRDNAPLAICFHGYRSIPVRDFSGGAIHCMELGHNVLLINQRGQGFSEGHTMTFGIWEQRDCLTWIQYANTRFGDLTPIFLYGISMGASTVLLASGHDLPSNIRGIIADCPFNSAAGIIRKVCVDRHYPPNLVFPFIALSARLLGHFSLSDGEVAPAIQKSSVPLLIIHGQDDRFVPFSMSQVLKEAFPDKIQLEAFPNAAHGISFLVDHERYLNVIDSFISSHL